MAKRQAPLARPKTMFKTAQAAWASLAKQTGLRPNQVTAAHTAKAWFWKLKGSVRRSTSKLKKQTSKLKRKSTKKRKSITKKTTRTKSNPGPRKSLAGKKGIAGMTRFKKFLLGLGVGAGVSTIAGLTRVREVEFLGPIIDAGVGGGIEGQVGVAIPKIIRLIAGRAGFNGVDGNLLTEGA